MKVERGGFIKIYIGKARERERETKRMKLEAGPSTSLANQQSLINSHSIFHSGTSATTTSTINLYSKHPPNQICNELEPLNSCSICFKLLSRFSRITQIYGDLIVCSISDVVAYLDER